ncbi:MAG: PepSY-associated TM helix domain-containing protein [Novosphingobium sp.]
MGKPRQIVRRIHLWLGLGLGALMALAGLTGSAVVFYVEIDGWLHPEQAREGRATLHSYDQAIKTLRAIYPDKQGQWRLEVTGGPGAIPARYYNPPETSGRDFAPMMVWLSSDGSRVLRRDYWGDYLMTWIYDLHYRLQLGKTGGVMFGYAGLALLALLLSGLWAWWPKGPWRKALRFKRNSAPSRRLHDIHKLAGLITFPILAMLTLTGVMLALPSESDAILATILGKPVAMPAPKSKSDKGAEIAPSLAVASALQVFPRGRVAWIEVPGPGQAPYRIRIQQPGDPSRRFPHSFAWVDQHDGLLLAALDADTAPPTTLVDYWLHPLHDGSVGGIWLRLLVLVCGLLPVLLLWSGLKRWLLRRSAR